MSAHDSTGVETTARDRPSSHELIRAGLLLGVYLVALVATAALSVGGAVYLTTTFSLSLPWLLVAWMVAVAGIAVAPHVGRQALSSVATRVDRTGTHNRTTASDRSPDAGDQVTGLVSTLANGLDDILGRG